MSGVTSSLEAALGASFENASLGGLLEFVAEVTQSASAPVWAVVQPAGNAGAVTASNGWVKLKAGWPTRSVKVLVTGPMLLLMLSEIFSSVPQGVFAGTV